MIQDVTPPVVRTVVALVIGVSLASAQPARLTSLVNPFIGTGGHGHTHPAATRPFGMVQLGPDTRMGGWDGSSGYHYSDARIMGFSHTHLSGTGIPDYGDVLLMPMSGTARTNNGIDGTPGYSSSFSHAGEIASPGYYGVLLDDSGIRAEMTATVRTGMHRYTFPAGREAFVVLDLEHRDEVLDALARVPGDRTIDGMRRSTSWAKDQAVYFSARFSRPFTKVRLLRDDTDVPGREASGRRIKVVLSFGMAGGPLLVKVGLSAVSSAGAAANVDAENPGWDFDAVWRQAEDEWERELSKIRIAGGTVAQQRIFYTALYHALLAPNVFMDADGSYRGRDGAAHRADGFTYHSVFSLWDTYRALHPLLTIIDQRRTSDFVQTFLRQFEQGGRLPVWELWANETNTMIGYHAVPVIADAWLKGIDAFDHDLAWRAMVHSAEEDRFGVGGYIRQGFVAADREPESVSKTLEYAYDDWTIAMVARRLGKTLDEARFLRRSQSWKHLFDPHTGFMRARQEGFWLEPFTPAEVNVHYTEANAWQYSFYVPHDVSGLMQAHGGPQAFAAKLDALFSADSKTSGREQADITGLVGQYAHGNEPSHHMAYLYTFAGQPWKTQALVRRLIDTMYADAPDGLAGNEDCGQMSAWLVFSALGFYPVTPGSGDYVIGAPLFDEATITLETGRTFTIRASGASPAAPYVQRATLNERPLTRAVVSHADIMAGGVLWFGMGTTPNTAWASAPDAWPHAAVTTPLISPAPFAVAGRSDFTGSTQLTLASLDPAATIHATVDGSLPTPDLPRITSPITIEESSTVHAIAVSPGSPPSAPVTFVLHEVPAGVSVATSEPWATQYSAGGATALIDGRRGGTDFRLGQWQGYRVSSFTATIDVGTARSISQVSAGFLHEPGAWVLMPRGIDVEVSLDGVRWSAMPGAKTTTDPRDKATRREDAVVRFASSTEARFVRVHIAGYGTLPAWHLGAGELSWIFVDEIEVR